MQKNLNLRKYVDSMWPARFIVALIIGSCLLAACGSDGVSAAASTPSAANASQTAASSTPTSPSGNSSGKAIPTNNEPSGNAQKLQEQLKALRMVDQQHGWGLTATSILKTTDGGVHWYNVTPPNVRLGEQSTGTFMNNQYAWVVNSQPNSPITVLRTSDGGKSWQSSKINDPDSWAGDMPHFLNTHEGFIEIIAQGGPGAGSESVDIFHTSDGGQSWSKVSGTDQQSSGLPRGGIKSGISFKDSLNGWATGEEPTNYPWLYATHDGGKTWKLQSLPDLPNPSGGVAFHTTPPVFFGAQGLLPVYVTGELTANTTFHGLLLYKTIDGGKTWATTYLANHAALGTFDSDNLYIVDIQHAWASDRNTGTLYATSDGGRSWQAIAQHMGNIQEFSFVDTTHGWAVGDKSLLRTSDGGHTWQRIS
ncbi:WD40/YVTN/BNR-like repeat-containing protein [Ktedonosporobacter rubrisoli]|nr:YCF48-related protein [Ktedonosporobacter rubrisoli]